AVKKEALCINCGCCVSECNAMESDPELLGPQALAKGFRFVGDPRDGATVERLEQYSGEQGIWECTRCVFCNERCPKGVDPRDSAPPATSRASAPPRSSSTATTTAATRTARARSRSRTYRRIE